MEIGISIYLLLFVVIWIFGNSQRRRLIDDQTLGRCESLFSLRLLARMSSPTPRRSAPPQSVPPLRWSASSACWTGSIKEAEAPSIRAGAFILTPGGGEESAHTRTHTLKSAPHKHFHTSFRSFPPTLEPRTTLNGGKERKKGRI